MPVDDLPAPPTFEALASWAGAGRLVRATEPDVSTWRLPAPQKAALTSSGIPLIDDLISEVSFHSTPTTYRLSRLTNEDFNVTWEYTAAQGSGEVLETAMPDGATRFVNSTINHWLCSLHLFGSRLSNSSALTHWPENEDTEQDALAELADLLDQIRTLDPPAVGAGDHQTHFWPATLDRWLY
ncbi:SUKH-4 family immunity protein [Spirillospora sp. NPDC052242]